MMSNQDLQVVSMKRHGKGVKSLSPGSNDSVSLYLNKIQVCVLPSKCSRHNAPSRPHALSKIVKSMSSIGSNTSQLIVIVCERSDVFASGCAVARVFPTFTRKTVSKAQEYTPDANVPKVLNHNVQVAFIIVDENNGGLTDNDVETLTQSASAIQLASRIVDTPCNEMHTDGFIAEVRKIGSELGITPLVIQGEELNQKGFGGIYGVGKAAVHQPAMVVLATLQKMPLKPLPGLVKVLFMILVVFPSKARPPCLE